MTRTLAFKLVLAFLMVSLTVAVLAALVVRWLTIQEFNQLVLYQAQSRFVSEMTTYYQANGSWQGVRDYLRLHSNLPVSAQPNPSGQPAPAGQQPRPGNNPAAQPQSLVFALLDANGAVVVPAGSYRMNLQVPIADLTGAAQITQDGKIVGYAIAIGEIPPLDLREQRYLARTDQALFYAALGATVIALLIGIGLARTLTHPLGELTAAIRAMGRGELNQQVQVRSSDEIGELAGAFNQMSAALTRSNDLRRQMTADIAHDLRTPLTVISGYIEAMRDQVLPPTPERLDMIYSEVQHLQHLVEDLRTLSLADAGELRLQRHPVAPSALLESCAAAHAHSAEQKGISLSVQVVPGLPEIDVDSDRMAQVLGNLVSNALRYTPAGGQVTLSADTQGKYTRLRVQDTGEGIPAEALPRIFDRFYRARNSRQRLGSESGLGLAIARSLVEAHGGTISVESTLGQGATFSILLK
jgi:signal transduction histidine kinase